MPAPFCTASLEDWTRAKLPAEPTCSPEWSSRDGEPTQVRTRSRCGEGEEGPDHRHRCRCPQPILLRGIDSTSSMPPREAAREHRPPCRHANRCRLPFPAATRIDAVCGSRRRGRVRPSRCEGEEGPCQQDRSSSSATALPTATHIDTVCHRRRRRSTALPTATHIDTVCHPRRRGSTALPDATHIDTVCHPRRRRSTALPVATRIDAVCGS